MTTVIMRSQKTWPCHSTLWDHGANRPVSQFTHLQNSEARTRWFLFLKLINWKRVCVRKSGGGCGQGGKGRKEMERENAKQTEPNVESATGPDSTTSRSWPALNQVRRSPDPTTQAPRQMVFKSTLSLRIWRAHIYVDSALYNSPWWRPQRRQTWKTPSGWEGHCLAVFPSFRHTWRWLGIKVCLPWKWMPPFEVERFIKWGPFSFPQAWPKQPAIHLHLTFLLQFGIHGPAPLGALSASTNLGLSCHVSGILESEVVPDPCSLLCSPKCILSLLFSLKNKHPGPQPAA